MQYTFDTIKTMYRRQHHQHGVDDEGRVVEDERARWTAGFPSISTPRDEIVKAYVLPINTRGLWGKIHGYLALESDGSTVSGFTVYQHSETPGLGGEIEKDWFQKNFKGKRIVDQGGNFVSIGIAKPAQQRPCPKTEKAELRGRHQRCHAHGAISCRPG